MNPKAMQQIQKMMNQMKNRPEDEVVEEFVALINSGQVGMSKQQIVQLIHTMQPMMNPKQKSTLNKLARRLSK